MEIPPFAGNNTFTKMDVIQFAYVEKFIFIESRVYKGKMSESYSQNN